MTRLGLCKAGSTILKIFIAAVCIFGAFYLIDLLTPPIGFSLWRENKTLFIIGLRRSYFSARCFSGSG